MSDAARTIGGRPTAGYRWPTTGLASGRQTGGARRLPLAEHPVLRALRQ